MRSCPIRICLSILIVFAFFIHPNAFQPAATGSPFADGETFTYRIKWKGNLLLPASEAGTISVRFAGAQNYGGRKLLRIETSAYSDPAFRHPMKGYQISLFTPDRHQSVLTLTLMEDGDERSQTAVHYYPELGALWLKEHFLDRKKGGPVIVSRNELHTGIPFPLLDPGAMGYLLRTMAGAPPSSFMSVYRARIKKVNVVREGYDQTDSVLGQLRSVRMNLHNLFGNAEEDPGEYCQIWVSDDSRHIPLRIKAKVKVGYVEAEIVRHDLRRESLIPTQPGWMSPPPENTPDIRYKLGFPPGTPPPCDMVSIPGGLLRFGEGSGKRTRQVRVSPFWMDRHEVTNDQYKRFIDATGHRAPDVMPFEYFQKKFNWMKDGYEEYLRLATPFRWKNRMYPQGKAGHPVVLVSWDDAQAYARWAGKRLPTEAEWEYAARGGLAGPSYPWGNGPDRSKANVSESDYLGTTPVGFIPSGHNPWGLWDMCGNASEWVQDAFSEDPFPEGAINPKGPSSGRYRIMRGGSWRSSIRYSTVWERARDWPENTYVTTGFRCARDKK